MDQTTGIAVGNEPESIYAVMSGKNFNGGCCFDYGTALSGPIFHHFDRIELDLRGNTHVRGAAFSCPRLKLADMVLI